MKQFNYNSLSARFYRWFYNQSYMPNNICPYFWKLVLAVVFCIPYGIYLLPVRFMKLSENDIKYWRNEEAGKFWKALFGWSLGALGISGILFCMSVPILWLFGIEVMTNKADQEVITGLGCVFWVFVIFIALLFYFKEYLNNGTRPERSPSVIGTWISDFYHKRCSIITWSNPNTKKDGTEN